MIKPPDWPEVAISNCKLCAWLCQWFCTDSDYNSDSINKKSRTWEREHSNEYELWLQEPDVDRLNQAFLLSTTDLKTAISIFYDLAERGSVSSMLELAGRFGWGAGVQSDFELASAWYKRALEAGSWMATLDYASLLAKSGKFSELDSILEDGVEKDWIPAFFWLSWYKNKRSKSSTTYQEIRPLLTYAAGKGHPLAQLFLARFTLFGKFRLREIPLGIKLARDHFFSLRSDTVHPEAENPSAENGAKAGAQ